MTTQQTIPQKAEVQKVDPSKTRSIGHYIFGKTLGEGTFGKVKVASHILTGEKVAIKILEKSKIFDVSDVERVSREIHILKMIRHPHLIQLYEIIETPKQLFLVMEYANGGELFDYIVQSQRIKDLEAARFFNQIISGIEYIHKLNIVHRDMKPENLLLDTKNRIKIVDFGLSNLYKKDELLKTACGSPCYAAPEMIAGKKYNGLQVDIWSCGVILYAMLCGYLPFEDPNTSALYKKILAGDYKIPKFVSSEGRDLLKNILNTDPTKRYTIDEIRKHPWFNLYRQSKIPQGIMVGLNKIPVDTILMAQLQAYGFNLEYCQKCIEGNRHNHVTTTYYLILKKHVANGGKSLADIGNDKFEPENLEQPKSSQKPLIFVQNQSYSNQNTAKIESTGGSSSKDKQDIEHQLFIRNQITSLQTQGDNTNKNTVMTVGGQDRKASLSIGETQSFKYSQGKNGPNSTQNNSLNQSLITNQLTNPLPQLKISNGKVKNINIEIDRTVVAAQEKKSSYATRRPVHSVYTQNNSIISSPREQNFTKTNENHSADNTRRVGTTNQQNLFINNLNHILNKPIDQPLFKTSNLQRQDKNKQPASNFNTTGMNEATEISFKNNMNNTIYRQNLHLVGETQTNFLQKYFNYVIIIQASTQKSRVRGASQHDGANRIQKRVIVGRESRGKSTEPFDEVEAQEPKVTSVLDTSNNSNQARTFYRSSRASPIIDTANNRQYVIPYHMKFKQENPTLANWRKKD